MALVGRIASRASHWFVQGAVRSQPSSSGADLIAQWRDNAPSTATALALTSGVETAGINATPIRGGSIGGTLTNQVTGAGLYCTVTAKDVVSGESRATSVDAGGSYGVRGLRDGSYVVSAQPSDQSFGVQWYQGAVTKAAATPVTVASAGDVAGVDFAMTASADLRVTSAGPTDPVEAGTRLSVRSKSASRVLAGPLPWCCPEFSRPRCSSSTRPPPDSPAARMTRARSRSLTWMNVRSMLRGSDVCWWSRPTCSRSTRPTSFGPASGSLVDRHRAVRCQHVQQLLSLAIDSVRRPDLDGSCWPDPYTEQVLRAALLPREDAIEAWEAVRDIISPREYVWADRPRLLPLVLANIGVDGAGPHAVDMKRLHRKAWFENQQHLRHAPRWLDPLHDEVPVMLLKGMALTQRAYSDLGLRSMSDVDVLVPSSQIGRATKLLTAAGWVDSGGRPLPPSWRVRHAVGLVHPDGGHIDLHHVPGVPFLGHTRHGEAVPEMWEAQVPGELGGRSVTVPAPEDLLLTVVVHGLTSILGSSSRWVADAMVLLRAEPMLWERFVAQATLYHVVVPTRSAMRYLADVFDAPVPADVLSALWAVPVSRGERRRFDTVTGAIGADEMWHRSSSTRGRWARLRTALGPFGAVRALPHFVASDIAKVDQVRKIPRALARRGRHRLVSRPVAR